MDIAKAQEKISRLEANIERVIRGKSDVVRLATIGLVARGHILFEDTPGVGKTTLAHCLARSLGLTFQRIQFTSDLLPSDILGVTVFEPATQEFKFREGPVFANIVLADELNRTTPKTQSALLEAMNTAQVSVERTTHDLPKPFIVIATQNPLESHGTFPLPHSQLDRFLLRVHVGYPDARHEREILMHNRGWDDVSGIEPVLTRDEVLEMQSDAAEIRVEESLVDYVLRVVEASRRSPEIEIGISTRGALAWRRCAQARAYTSGRDYCIPDDFKAVAGACLAHRIVPRTTWEDAGGGVGVGSAQIRSLLDTTAVPV